MYRTELSDLEKIEQYLICLDTENPSYEKSAKMTLLNEFFKLIDDGKGEPVEIAYLLYEKYGEWYSITNNDIFWEMCDEALFIVDLCDSEIIF